MTEAMPNHAAVTAQAMIFCYAPPDLVNRYMIIPLGLENCEIRHIHGKTIRFHESDTIKDVASMIFKYVNDTQLGIN